MNIIKFALGASAAFALLATAATAAPAAAPATAAPAPSAAPATAPRPAAPARVHFAGCVEPGVEMKCLMAKSGGKTYNVTSGAAVLKAGMFAAGTGVASGGVSMCQQGEILTDIVLDKPQPPHADCQPTK